MTRRRKVRNKKERTINPEDVLNGRFEARLEELFDLIHEVNPTGHRLAKVEAEQRYRLKHRLQGLLIERFGDELTVETTEEDGVVSLMHFSGTRDACHAVVEDLEPPARAWVQHQFDLAASPPADSDEHVPWVPPESRAPGVSDLVRQAQQAIHDYDYESAERLLLKAFEASSGSVYAALPLVELWVETLGLDRQALELAPRLAGNARRHGTLRLNLALAAARCREYDRAGQWVQGLEAQGAAEVHVLLAEAAVGDHDLTKARRHLGRARRRDPAHPELPRLTDEVDALEAESHRPAEEALLERYEREGARAVEAAARDLQSRWSSSEVARRILREIGEEERRHEIAEHLERGEQALAEERFEDVVAHLHKALELGCQEPGLEERIAEARERVHQREEEHRLEAAVARFETDRSSALLGYLALPENLRAAVRRKVEASAFAWLEEAAAPSSGARAKATVAAVLVFERARDALPGTSESTGWAEKTLAELDAHLPALRGVAEAQRIHDDVRRRVEDMRRRQARNKLDQAHTVLGERKPEWTTITDSQFLIDSIDLASLDADERQAAEKLLVLLGKLEDRRRCLDEYERRRAEGDLPAALGCAQELEALFDDDEEERKLWAARQSEVRAEIRTAWKIEIVDEPAGDAATPMSELRDVSPVILEEGFRAWLTDDGAELVLARAWDRWLFLWRLDLARERLISSASLVPPTPLGNILTMMLDGDRLWIVGSRGHVLELVYGSWDVRSWRTLHEVLPAETNVENARMIPGTEYLWLQDRPQGGKGTTCVIDLAAWRLGRKIPSEPYMMPIMGIREPLVVGASGGLKSMGGGSVYTARGVPLPRGELPSPGRVVSACVAPDGESLILVVNRVGLDGWEIGRGDLIRLERTPTGSYEIAASLEIPDLNAIAWHPVMTALDLGLVFLLKTSQGHESHLIAYRSTATGFEERYRLSVPFDSILVQDRRSHKVALLYVDKHSMAVWIPPPDDDGTAPIPDELPGLRRHESRLPNLEVSYICAPLTRARDVQELWANVIAVRRLRGEARTHHIREMRAKRSEEEFVQILANALTSSKMPGDRDEYQRYLERMPEYSAIALYAADQELDHSSMERARELLGGIDPDRLNDRKARHYHHLLGLYELHHGRRDAALEILRDGTERPTGDCPLESLRDLLTVMPESPEESEWSLQQTVPLQILGMLRVADQALAAGDASTARAALDRPAFWQAHSRQAAARLAAAWLELEAETPAERLTRKRALGVFLHLMDPANREDDEVQVLDHSEYQETFFADLVWSEERLTELARKVGSRLDGEDQSLEAIPDCVGSLRGRVRGRGD